jgi:hypothetical protein
MAVVELTLSRILKWNDLVTVATPAALTADGAKYNANSVKDSKTILRVSNPTAGAVNLVVSAGDSVVAGNDLTISVPATTTGIFALENARYIRLNSEVDNGYIFIKGTGLLIEVLVAPVQFSY